MPKKTPLISIVDDDESVRETTKGLMRSLGYVADAFTSAEEFLESGHVYDYSNWAAKSIDCPRLSTAYYLYYGLSWKLRTRALDAGVLAFLSKPFSEDSLIKHLDEALLNRC